jgi:predicted glycoside hydrolase/deacetylase ChbG (UPF0249 family)
MTRFLIVNADDFGHSTEVNAGIVQAHERGIVTSASLMVRRPAAEEAAAYRGRLSLGLHVELGEWTVREGEWVVSDEVPQEQVALEVHTQAVRFRELVGREPTHLDSHQHVHQEGVARDAVVELGRELGIPVRSFSKVRYVGGFYGQTDTGEPWHEGVTVENLIGLLEKLEPGITELGCHPGQGAVRGTTYAYERTLELATLCDPRVHVAVDEFGLELIDFSEVAAKE